MRQSRMDDLQKRPGGDASICTPGGDLLRWALLWMVFAIHWLSTPHRAVAGEVELKNGTVVRGNIKLLTSLTGQAPSRHEPTTVFHTVAVDAGWKTLFIPKRQIPEGGLRPDTVLSRRETFEIPQIRTGREFAVTSAGSILDVSAWSEFGRRTLSLATARGPVPIVQGITKLSPEYAQITSLTHAWEFGVALNTIPIDVVLGLLHRTIDAASPQDRLAIVRFCVLAEYYPQAFQELDAISMEFPDLAQQLTAVRADLMEAFGASILRELQQRRQAGQHRLAEEYALKLSPVQVGPEVSRAVEQFLKQYSEARANMARIKLLLGDLQAQLPERFDATRLAELRSEVSEQLDYVNWTRLEPLLKSEADPQLTPEEKLAIAYSGWVLGPANAITTLSDTLSVWEARQLVREYLAERSSITRTELLAKLTQLESIGPQRVLQIVQQMTPPVPVEQNLVTPPPPEAPAEQPASPLAGPTIPGGLTFTIPLAGSAETVTYHAVLPPEYSPFQTYPALVVLAPADRGMASMAELWAGSEELPGWARRRGYIVLLPEYADPETAQYNYSTSAHERVLGSLRDARSRLSIDANRVFLTGHGRGADATFDLALSHPDEFAGLIPFGGRCAEYCKFYLENGVNLPWYVISGELDRDLKQANAPLFDRICIKGIKYDFQYVEYVRRGLDSFADELPAVFEWMSQHVRKEWPKEFEVTSMRRTDNSFFWLRNLQLPRHVVLPAPIGTRLPTTPMVIEGRIPSQNVIFIKSPSTRHSLWLTPEMVDVNARVKVKVGGGQTFNDFVTMSIETILEDQRFRADRQRPWSIRIDI